MADRRDAGRSRLLKDLDKTLDLSRFPKGLWVLLVILYTPIGVFLALLRTCMSLQAVLMLLVFPEGAVKRFMLRIFLGALGIVVTTEGFHRKGSNTKVFVGNRLSYVDHIVLHLVLDCTTVSTGGQYPPMASLFPHHVFRGEDGDSLTQEAKQLPEFDDNESVVDFTPFVIQPEFMPTNGTHLLLKFNSWPFALDSTVQPIAITSARPMGIKLTTAESSGWWDLFWILFLPCTVFHIKMLLPLEQDTQEMPQEFARRVQQTIASELQLQRSEVTQVDVNQWLADPPKPDPPPPPPPQTWIPQGPIIPPSEFTPSSSSSSSPSSLLSLSPEIETMVQQVTAVLPQVPHTVIRKDLLKTRNVDVTITNILEERVRYDPIPTFHELTAASSNSGRGGGSTVVSRRTNFSSVQRQLSLEERKRNLLEQARRHYIEKHGLQPRT